MRGGLFFTDTGYGRVPRGYCVLTVRQSTAPNPVKKASLDTMAPAVFDGERAVLYAKTAERELSYSSHACRL